MVKVRLHGDLGEALGSEWNLKINSVAEAIRAIEANTGKMIKNLIKSSEENAKYEIFINDEPVKIPNENYLPKSNKELNYKHIQRVQNSEICANFEDDFLKTIDIVPVIEGAGGGGGGGGGCFPSKTKISTPNGYRNIEDLKDGDEVLCFDKDKNIVASRIEKKFYHQKDKILKITLWGDKIIRATPNHWFLNEYNRFAPLSQFKVGDVLIHESGDVLPIEKIEEDGYEEVYNMHVEKFHTYIAEDILVHNGGGGKGGGKGGGMMKGVVAIFLGIVLGAVTFGISTTLGMTFLPAILGLVAVGVSLMLAKPPPMVSPAAIANPSASFDASPTEAGGEPSYMFDGPVNTIGEGGPIPVGYGRLIIGSHQVFASYDQLYRIQSRARSIETSGPFAGYPKLSAGEGTIFPSQSFYFNLNGYPVTVKNIRGDDMSTESIAPGN